VAEKSMSPVGVILNRPASGATNQSSSAATTTVVDAAIHPSP
jgi:hypothetical protein